ncbi:unnamed protein product [marine sediment metagenome]|uniref:HTH psq-type domain-containing protein n=1 Tax=marine sediment metagenome TaxID=412755 RepID=X1JH10_9ZZZZ
MKYKHKKKRGDPKLYSDIEFLHKQYRVLGKSSNRIGREYNLNPTSILSALHKYRIKVRTQKQGILLSQGGR